MDKYPRLFPPTPDSPDEYWWRVDCTYHGGSHGLVVTPCLERYFVIRETKQGVVLNHTKADYARPGDRLVLRGSRKKFAYPTKSEAIAGWVIRQRSRIQHARGALETAQMTNIIADELEANDAK